MNQKQVCQLNNEGYFIGVTVADESPLEPGVFLMPFGTVDADVPSIPDGKRAKWNGSWVFEDLPAPPPKLEPPELTYAELREREYPLPSEYLDGLVKGDQAQIDAYIAKCLAVKAKYPKPA
jgi:hypothetical protein